MAQAQGVPQFMHQYIPEFRFSSWRLSRTEIPILTGSKSHQLSSVAEKASEPLTTIIILLEKAIGITICGFKGRIIAAFRKKTYVRIVPNFPKSNTPTSSMLPHSKQNPVKPG